MNVKSVLPPVSPRNEKSSLCHLGFINTGRLLLICVMMLASTCGCRTQEKSTTQTPASSNHQPSIVTTSYPLEWVTQELAGDQYTVNFPAGASDQPDRWRPDRKTIAEIQAADLIISNGVAAPYANWMKTVSLPSAKVVETASQGMSLSDFISVQDIQLVHSHGPEGEHSHPTMVSRTWLDPVMLTKQADYITQQLCKQYPDKANEFKDNLATVTTKLKSITPQPSPEPTTSVYAATPELKFLTRAAGVNDLHFNWNENTTLAQAEADLAEKKPASAPKFILFPQRLETLAEQLTPLLQQQKTEPVFVDMLDKAIANRDFLKRLSDNFAKMQKITSD